MKEFLLQADPVGELWILLKANRLAELEPSLAELKMDIPQGYHHKDNLEHSIRVLDKAIGREPSGPDLILRTAALFHDIGKPATREFHGRGKVTFMNHEGVGARQVRSILKRHNYTRTEVAEIERIIALHMRAYGFGETSWSDSAVRRLATDAGSQETLDRLIIVFYSDLTTKNDQKRRKVEHGIALLEDALARVRAADARKALRPAINGRELMELTGLKEGRELGLLMKTLNGDKLVGMSRECALAALRVQFPEYFAE